MDFTRLSWEYHGTNWLTHMICGLNSGEQSHPRLKWVASWSHELWALYPCIKWQVQVILFDTVLLKCAQQKCFCTHTIIIKITIIICIYIYIFMHNHMHNIYICVSQFSLSASLIDRLMDSLVEQYRVFPCVSSSAQLMLEITKQAALFHNPCLRYAWAAVAG
jgi:hypothetical protein